MTAQSYFLEGKKIYLRPVSLEDVNETYYHWLNDPEVNQFLETRFTLQNMGRIREYVQSLQDKKDTVFLAICLKENDRHIGNIKLGPINWFHRIADVSLFIGAKDCWGKGLATESICLVAQYAFEQLNLHKITAGCYEKNIGSAKVFKKAGFSEDVVFKDHLFFEGSYQDKICFRLLQTEYKV